MRTPSDVAAAFSRHRFSEAYEALSEDVRWVAIGGNSTIGREAVIEVCEGTARALANTTTEFPRFLIIDGGDAVAVDSVARYVDAAGDTTAVASCDVYEFRDGLVVRITSYTVALEPTG